jgi:uncharacterized protein DUF6636
VKTLGAGLLAAVCVASASAAPLGYETFKTPSGKIACGYATIAGHPNAALLRCDILTGLKPKVHRPPGCHYDFGSTLELRRTGPARIGCVSDAIGKATRVLGYGKTWRGSPFTCSSARTGLTCKNKSGRGFFLSRQRWRRV